MDDKEKSLSFSGKAFRANPVDYDTRHALHPKVQEWVHFAPIPISINYPSAYLQRFYRTKSSNMLLPLDNLYYQPLLMSIVN